MVMVMVMVRMRNEGEGEGWRRAVHLARVLLPLVVQLRRPLLEPAVLCALGRWTQDLGDGERERGREGEQVGGG